MEIIKEKYFTAIVCVNKNNNKTFLKYRNILSDEGSIRRFMNFAGRFSGVMYVNFYNKTDKTFVRRVKIGV
jgi:hypothetical protein